MEVQHAPGKTLWDTLVEAALITEEQLREAMDILESSGESMEEYMVGQGWLTEYQLTLFTSLYLGVPFINVNRQDIQQDALDLVPERIARKYRLIPISVENGALTVAMEDPRNLDALEELAIASLKRVDAFISTPNDIQETIDRYYRVSGEIERQLSMISMGSESDAEGALEAQLSAEAIAQAPVVRALDLLITQAIQDRSSDIHVEPQEDRLRIRFRTDGILHEIMNLPLSAHSPFISRIKIMAGMNIAERRRPQDGQISFKMRDREVDIRVATSNTIYGEMSVLRLLDKSFALYTLPQLGFLPDTYDGYTQMLKSPFGMVLVSGPTGAGKTTTLYASVAQLDRVGRNIITIEDPVEYRFDDINQMPVNVASGFTFAAGLRATMRLDPNVILVGEIRDPETAQIAVQAALTGHLVLSSVHANDTAGVIVRLIDLGVEPFMAASALVGVVAQRMVRRLCAQCTRSRPAIAEEKLAYETEMHETRDEFLYGDGCNFCSGTGYVGRTGIYEVMQVSEEIRRLILTNSGSDAIRHQAREEGMSTLWHDGMTKVKMGITTPQEVIRNVFTLG